MKNKYAGICYVCGQEVKAGEGRFEEDHARVSHFNKRHPKKSPPLPKE